MRSYLLIGNQTLDSPELADAIRERLATGPASFHVVVPVTPVGRGLTWDETEARAAAMTRLDEAMGRLRAAGAECSGEVGSRDPVEAALDALRKREVDEVILSTLPSGISRWLGEDVPSRLRGAVTAPVAVVTTARESVASG